MVSLPLVDLLDILVSSGWGFPGAKKMLKGMGGGGLTAVTLEPWFIMVVSAVRNG